MTTHTLNTPVHEAANAIPRATTAVRRWLVIGLSGLLLALTLVHLWHVLTVPNQVAWAVPPQIAAAGETHAYAPLDGQPAPWWRSTAYRLGLGASALLLALGFTGQLRRRRDRWRLAALACTALGGLGLVAAHLAGPGWALENGVPHEWGRTARYLGLGTGVLLLCVAWLPAPPRWVRALPALALLGLTALLLVPVETQRTPFDYHRIITQGEWAELQVVAPAHRSITPVQRLLEIHPLMGSAARDLMVSAGPEQSFRTAAAYWRFRQVQILCLVALWVLGLPLALLTLFQPRWPGRAPVFAGLGLLGLVVGAFAVYPYAEIGLLPLILPGGLFLLAMPTLLGATSSMAEHTPEDVYE